MHSDEPDRHDLPPTLRSRLARDVAGARPQPHRTGQSTTVLRHFETRLVPGVLQTERYARAVFTKIGALRGLEPEVEEAVAARLRRRAYLQEAHRTFEFLLAEAVLTEPVHGLAVQIEQVAHLATVLDAPRIRLGILPADRPLSLVAEHAFALHDATAVIDGFLGELVVEGADAAFLHHVMDRLWADAVEGDQARRTLAAALRCLRSSVGDRL